MASISRDKSRSKVEGKESPDTFRVLFTGADGERRTLYLGAVTPEAARVVKRMTELISGSQKTGSPMPDEAAAWIAGLDQTMTAKLIHVGLIRGNLVLPGVSSGRMRSFNELYGQDAKVQSLLSAVISLQMSGPTLRQIIGMLKFLSRPGDSSARLPKNHRYVLCNRCRQRRPHVSHGMCRACFSKTKYRGSKQLQQWAQVRHATQAVGEILNGCGGDQGACEADS